jgi:alkaline phosphatase D
MSGSNRRIFIVGGIASVGVAVLSASPALSVPYPFTLGVASGEPAPDGFVIWTRLAPSPLNADGLGGMSSAPVTVEWQVSNDQYFTQLARTGTVTAVQTSAHSVHVEVTGLQPGREYWYRFRASGHISQVGRARTAPAVGTSPTMTMLFASCSHFEAGYFTAYRRMAEEHPDLILHLGDYIYENAPVPGVVRRHEGDEAITLADYRQRYAQYKTDPDLQAAHLIAPWVVAPDDHEVEDNYAGLARADDYPHLTTGQFRARRAAAYRAYYENMPLRPANSAHGAGMALYRRIRWGRLATFHMLDTRQFRDDQVAAT